jgi:hypothetical protein
MTAGAKPAMTLFAALPGYLLSMYGMDRWGRKTIQVLGFGLMAVTFIGIALIGDAKSILVPFVILYGLNYFFTELGPNTTTSSCPRKFFRRACARRATASPRRLAKRARRSERLASRSCNRHMGCRGRCGSPVPPRSSGLR